MTSGQKMEQVYSYNPRAHTGWPTVCRHCDLLAINNDTEHRRLVSAWVHCAGSATHQATEPEP